ncbi:UDP-3-O-acyl-N-acetylglucosamine deacetylase [Verrucomicrobium spinosum]|uniref:UDP-3-O-acyl-N-acetylglucosamine deacetylase n=1 Tax=Verrucomicrobium spinosum TaxID=2736 RepID=UPI0021097D36|nr:UDP-3-O-acyl-N-acetylglucosamine deacetylase [Verrucomicrobium spinosum]
MAPARTFVFYEDIAPLLEKGLIKGGTLESAVVIRGDTALSKHPLRFKEEFVRHKILDIVGDLALFGRRIKARHRRAPGPWPQHGDGPRAAPHLQ